LKLVKTDSETSACITHFTRKMCAYTFSPFYRAATAAPQKEAGSTTLVSILHKLLNIVKLIVQPAKTSCNRRPSFC